MNQKKLLFTPGPLTTSETVKQSMLRDLGSRDAEFLSVVSHIRHRLLELGRVTDGSYEAVLMQGSGTFAIESVLSSVIPCNGKLLVAINGSYGHRMATIARVLGIVCQTIVFDEDTPVQAGRVHTALSADPTITHVGAIHCETSTGILNPTNELGHAVRELQRTFIVDGMSSFGGIPMDLSAGKIDFLISSANKCIQGVPGFAFILGALVVGCCPWGRFAGICCGDVARRTGAKARTRTRQASRQRRGKPMTITAPRNLLGTNLREAALELAERPKM